MRTIVEVLLSVLMLFGAGCTLFGYKEVGGESYRIRGHTAATLGSWGLKDKAGLHSFECLGTPPGIEDLEVEVLCEFAAVDVVDVTGKLTVPIASLTDVRAAPHYQKAERNHLVVRRIDKQTLVKFYNKPPQANL